MLRQGGPTTEGTPMNKPDPEGLKESAILACWRCRLTQEETLEFLKVYGPAGVEITDKDVADFYAKKISRPRRQA